MAIRHYDAQGFTTGESIGYLLKLARTLLHDRAVAAIRGHDLGFMHWLVLALLREGAGTAAELCRIMSHDTGAITRLLDQLQRRGFVERRRSAADRRVVRLALTAAGRRKLAELMPLVVDVLNGALAGFSRREFAQLRRLLRKLIGNLRSAERPRGAAQ